MTGNPAPSSGAIDLGEALGQPLSAIACRVGPQLRALYPDRALIEGASCSFDLDDFANASLCTVEPVLPEVYCQIATDWRGPVHGIGRSRQNGWYRIRWQGQSLEVVLLTWPKEFRSEDHYWIVANTAAVADAFFTAVCEHEAVLTDMVLVFDGGSWKKSRELHDAIKGATFDNLVLRGDLKAEVRKDLTSFLSGRDTYARYGVPWKRGVLLIGPPGNGKTHMVKALINSAGDVPCLYVKSFKSRHMTDHDAIRSVFQRARQATPCILVLEDLDSLIDAGNRSFFLNELDGFASNAGIVTLATTNHPERLDTAIVDRPSRFDRKYHFDLPGLAERQQYIGLWNGELQSDLRLTDDGIVQAAALTDGFSFAYLKELFLTCIMRWINGVATPGEGEASMDTVIAEQIALLREQMSSMDAAADSRAFVATDGFDRMAAMAEMAAMMGE